MEIRFAEERDFLQLAEMKWQHGVEDDADYGEHNLEGVDKNQFISQFVAFLTSNYGYTILVAEERGIVASAMFLYMIPKVPKPNGKADCMAYLTNVYTAKEYRSQGIGTKLLRFVKDDLAQRNCELIFVWPSKKSVDWYLRNDFTGDNAILEYRL